MYPHFAGREANSFSRVPQPTLTFRGGKQHFFIPTEHPYFTLIWMCFTTDKQKKQFTIFGDQNPFFFSLQESFAGFHPLLRPSIFSPPGSPFYWMGL